MASIPDRAEDVQQVGGLLGLLANGLLVFLLFGLIAIVLNAVEDTTGVNVDLTDLLGESIGAIRTVLESMFNSIGEVLT